MTIRAMLAQARSLPVALTLALVVVACAAGPTPSLRPSPGPTASPVATPAPAGTTDPALARLAATYRCLSRALYYDAGGGGGTGTCQLLPPLVLGADGRWSWSSSSGTWSLRPVAEADWQRWGIAPYGSVSEVVVLDGLGDGPFEPVDRIIWVVYHDDAVAGAVWLKWGPAS